MNSNTITPMTILGTQVLASATGQVVDFDYDRQGRLKSIVGRCRHSEISSESTLHYRPDTDMLRGVESFGIGPMIDHESRSTDIVSSSFHMFGNSRVEEILSDRTVHMSNDTFRREHLYRNFEFKKDRLVTVRDEGKTSMALKYDHQGNLVEIETEVDKRLIGWDEKGRETSTKQFVKRSAGEKPWLHLVHEYAENDLLARTFSVHPETGKWSLDSIYRCGEVIPKKVAVNSVANHWFDEAGHLQLSVRGNLDEERPIDYELDVSEMASNPGAYLLDFEGSLDLTIVSPDRKTQLHVLKLSERVPELVQILRLDKDEQRVLQMENAPGIGFNQCCAAIKAQATAQGFRFVAAQRTISDFPGSVTV